MHCGTKLDNKMSFGVEKILKEEYHESKCNTTFYFSPNELDLKAPKINSAINTFMWNVLS